MNVKNLIQKYSENLPREKYEEKYFRTLPSLKWGQRKLLITLIQFLTKYYHCYKQDEKKYLLYVGASPGYNINYLMKLFPDIHFIMYDKVDTEVDLSQKNVEFYQRYFTDEDAYKYANKNLFFVCDIRTLDTKDHHNIIREIKQRIDKKTATKEDYETLVYHEEQANSIIDDNMVMQQKWANIMNPLKSHLKFRLKWDQNETKYFDGDIYFQPWIGNGSIEMRIVPNGKEKVYNNKIAEEVCFWFNKNRRREKLVSPFKGVYPFHDNILEAVILAEYLVTFKNYSYEDNEKLGERVYEMVNDITTFLSREGSIYLDIDNRFLELPRRYYTKKYENEKKRIFEKRSKQRNSEKKKLNDRKKYSPKKKYFSPKNKKNSTTTVTNSRWKK